MRPCQMTGTLQRVEFVEDSRKTIEKKSVAKLEGVSGDLKLRPFFAKPATKVLHRLVAFPVGNRRWPDPLDA